jgi:hypothetical protein
VTIYGRKGTCIISTSDAQKSHEVTLYLLAALWRHVGTEGYSIKHPGAIHPYLLGWSLLFEYTMKGPERGVGLWQRPSGWIPMASSHHTRWPEKLRYVHPKIPVDVCRRLYRSPHHGPVLLPNCRRCRLEEAFVWEDLVNSLRVTSSKAFWYQYTLLLAVGTASELR